MVADPDAAGFSLAEGLVTLALLLLLAGIALAQGPATLASLRVESVTRRLALGIDQGRLAAERSGQPCALQLDERGWHAPATGDLPACPGVELSLGEGLADSTVQLSSNFPPLVRFSSNGLVLDGGTVRVAAAATPLERCLVMALPLGVVRVGRWSEEAGCRPDPNL